MGEPWHGLVAREVDQARAAIADSRYLERSVQDVPIRYGADPTPAGEMLCPAQNRLISATAARTHAANRGLSIRISMHWPVCREQIGARAEFCSSFLPRVGGCSHTFVVMSIIPALLLSY
jgi:hypothetical protein